MSSGHSSRLAKAMNGRNNRPQDGGLNPEILAALQAQQQQPQVLLVRFDGEEFTIPAQHAVIIPGCLMQIWAARNPQATFEEYSAKAEEALRSVNFSMPTKDGQAYWPPAPVNQTSAAPECVIELLPEPVNELSIGGNSVPAEQYAGPELSESSGDENNADSRNASGVRESEPVV